MKIGGAVFPGSEHDKIGIGGQKVGGKDKTVFSLTVGQTPAGQIQICSGIVAQLDPVREIPLLILHDGSMGQRSVAVSGVFNNYVGGQMVMSEAAYEALFGEKPAQNCFWVKCDALCRAEVVRLLRSLPVTVTESSAKQAEYQSYTAALDVIAALLAGIAALMAGGVLLNLIYLQYYRKKRSLVVMRINGFTAWETLGYVLGESVVTHVIGLLLGIAGGAWLGRRIILLMEARQLHIVRSVQPMAWLISLLIMLLFSFVIHAVIARAVVRLKPTEDVMTR